MAFELNDTMLLSLVVEAKDHATQTLHGIGQEMCQEGEIAGGAGLGDLMFLGIEEAGRSMRELGAD